MPKRPIGASLRGVRPRVVLDVGRALAERLGFVPLLDGRPIPEWCRAVLADAVARLQEAQPGWGWARAGAPWWREGGTGGAPVGALAGGERVLVLAAVGPTFERAADPDGEGDGLLVDVVPGEGAPMVRRAVVRASDVLPWRRRRGEPLPSGSPGAAVAEARARAWAERERAQHPRGRGGQGGATPRAEAGGPPVDAGAAGV